MTALLISDRPAGHGLARSAVKPPVSDHCDEHDEEPSPIWIPPVKPGG